MYIPEKYPLYKSNTTLLGRFIALITDSRGAHEVIGPSSNTYCLTTRSSGMENWVDGR